ncbi:hypothetical protein JCM6882_002214 [Rhodosporidiobolus microsporus]
MVLLPAETLDEICAHVYADEDVKLAQRTFFSLSVASRALNKVVTPWLYRRAVLVEDWKRTAWERTYVSRMNPWSLSCGTNSEAFARPRELRIVYEGSTFSCPFEDMDLFEFEDTVWPDWRRLQLGGVFNCLTSLTLFDPHPLPADIAFLVRPAATLRRQLTSFTYGWSTGGLELSLSEVLYFILEVFQFFDPILFGRVTAPAIDFPESYYTVAEDAEPWATHLPAQRAPPTAWVAPPAAVLLRAHVDWSTFESIWCNSQTRYRDGSASIFSKPPSTCPFACLSFLHLPVTYEQQIFLILYTSIFPSLRILVLQGAVNWLFPLTIETMRFSLTSASFSLDALTSPRLFTSNPPAAQDDERTEINWEEGTWAPMTDDEVAAYPLKPYRGPKLEKLDMGRLDVKPLQ